MKTTHYVLVYQRAQHAPAGLVRVPGAIGAASFVASEEDARRKVLRLCGRHDRVCWWTWDPGRGRLIQRL